MLKIFNIEALIMCSFCTVTVFIKEIDGAACSKRVNVEHGAAIGCTIRGGVEFVNVKCDEGYEFKANDAEREYWIDDAIVQEGLRCNGIKFY